MNLNIFDFNTFLDTINNSKNELIATVVIIILFYSIKSIINRIVNRKLSVVRKRYLITQTINYVFLILTILMLLVLWFDEIRAILPALSLVAGATIIASKEIVQNFFANIVIFSRGLFQVGDRIQIGETVGDVVETGPFYVTLAEVGNWVDGDETTGRLIKIPNNLIFTKNLSNYSRANSLIWNEIKLRVSPESNLDETEKIFTKILSDISYKFDNKIIQEFKDDHVDIMFMQKEPSFYKEIKDDYIEYTLRYACKFYKRRTSENEVWDNIIKISTENRNLKIFKFDTINNPNS